MLLQINLKRLCSLLPNGQLSNLKDNTNLAFSPVLHNGEYSYTLSSSNGMIPGAYILSINNLGVSTQSIRLNYKVYPTVRAITIRGNQKLIGRNNNGEFSYYRFTLTDPAKLLTVRVHPLHDGSASASTGAIYSPSGDPDLFVTNRYNGMVGVTRDNWVWRSCSVGADRIDIHPSDMDVKRGSTFIIGVLGYKDRNEFEIEVSALRR